MIPTKYFELCRRHSRLVKAKRIVKRCKSNTVSNIKQKILFRQETGFMPQDYIDQFDKKD